MTARPPAFSIVVAAWHDALLLDQCLAHLMPELATTGNDCEVVIARNFAWTPIAWPAAIPRTDLECPTHATVPELRAAGVAVATRSHIVLLEDHGCVTSGWMRAFGDQATATPDAILVGAVQAPAAARASRRAIFLYDYGSFAPPIARTVRTFCGLNAALPRELIGSLVDATSAGVNEAVISRAAQARGVAWLPVSSAIVEWRGPESFSTAMRQAWHLGRLYGAERTADRGPVHRLLRVTSVPLLIVVLPIRTLLREMMRRRHILPLLPVIPALALLHASWAAGEGCGYLFGAGNSAAAWR